MTHPALLALANGICFHGYSMGSTGCRVGEIVFNTALVGYQEILTDPSYAQQFITLTYPHIGNTGVNDEDKESEQIHALGLVIRDLPFLSSNWRMQQSLPDYLKSHGVLGIYGIGTRQLTHILRQSGSQSACLWVPDEPKTDLTQNQTVAIDKARAFKGLAGMNLASVVSTSKDYVWTQTAWGSTSQEPQDSPLKVVVYDFGVKHSILRRLAQRGLKVEVVPAHTSFQAVLERKPQGVLLSNGPGDPAACTQIIAEVKQLLAHDLPIFGICLGHQILALALGAKTIKMKFGHHGANHPVQNLGSKHVFISSQNHGFMVDSHSLPSCLKPSHISLFDGSLQGFSHTQKPVFGFQGHPEAGPGPEDLDGLFDLFVQNMKDQSIKG